VVNIDGDKDLEEITIIVEEEEEEEILEVTQMKLQRLTL
jgi:hypothetical protein